MPTGGNRSELGRALADGLARALASGDVRTARIALAALSGLVDDGDDAPGEGVVSERRKRGER